MITLTFGGSSRVMPNYNVMGVAKAALEASVRYLASDFGPQGIRVNALSPGPVRTLAGAGVTDARAMYSFQRAHSPLRRSVTIEDVGGSALYFLSGLSARRDRRNPSHRRGLQYHLDAAARGDAGAARRGRCRRAIARRCRSQIDPHTATPGAARPGADAWSTAS